MSPKDRGLDMRIADVLRGKGTGVATVDPTATVAELIGELASHNVGALPVVDGGRLVGIVSERDVVRRLHADGPGLLEARVGDIMITGVTTCAPGDSVSDIAAVMTNRRFRHLPVVVEGKLAGIVSIGDLVKARIDLLESEREQLQSYIVG
jgi:CBS domain-containing protein